MRGNIGSVTLGHPYAKVNLSRWLREYVTSLNEITKRQSKSDRALMDIAKCMDLVSVVDPESPCGL